MGDISRQSIAEVWNGKAFKKLRKAILTIHLPNVCRSCQWMRWGSLTTIREFDMLDNIDMLDEISFRDVAKITALNILPKVPFSRYARKLLRYIYMHS